MENKKEVYVSEEELLKKYKWTKKLIEDFLPSPSPFPLSLIQEIEKREDFQKKFSQIEKRRERDKKKKEEKTSS